MGIDSDLIRGHIDTIILKILKDGDRYGYEICKEVEDKTGGAYELKQPTLYSCLKRLEDQKQISSYWQDSDIGGKRHYYKLTEVGLNTLNKNQEDWQKSRSIIDSLIYMSEPMATAPQEVFEPQKQLENDETLLIENEDPLQVVDEPNPLQIENKDPEQIENEDPLQIVDEPNPLQIENEDPVQIENEDPLQIVDEPNPLQIEDKDFEEESSTSLIEDNLDNEIIADNEDDNADSDEDNDDNIDEDLEKPLNSKSIKTAYDSFFDDDDEDEDDDEEDNELKENKHDSEEEKQAIASIFGVDEHIQSMDEEESDDEDEDEEDKDEDEDEDDEEDDNNDEVDVVNDENVVQPDFLPTPPTIFDEVEKLTKENLELEQDDIPEKPVEVEEIRLNKDESDFDVDKYLGKGSSYFNSGANQKASLHSFMKNLKKTKDKQEEQALTPEPVFEESVEDNSKRFSHYNSNESDVRYEEPESEFNHIIEPTTPSDSIKNVDFQNDEDKEFVDEIMLNFSEQKSDNVDDRFDGLNYVNDHQYEAPTQTAKEDNINTSKRISEQMNSNVRFAQENADMISIKNADITNDIHTQPTNNPKQNKTNAIQLPDVDSAGSIDELKDNMEKIGIKVKPYSKIEKSTIVSRDYLLTNKIKFVRSFISCCFVVFLLCFSYIILDNYNVFDNTLRGTYIYYLLGILGSLLIPTIYGFIYLSNPFKKQPPKFAFRLSFLFSLLFFMQALVIIFATNIMLGFVSFAQIDYNHIQWIVPSILSLWFLFQPIVHYYLFTSKKFFV